jgi:hypothetical protein
VGSGCGEPRTPRESRRAASGPMFESRPGKQVRKLYAWRGGRLISSPTAVVFHTHRSASSGGSRATSAPEEGIARPEPVRRHDSTRRQEPPPSVCPRCREHKRGAVPHQGGGVTERVLAQRERSGCAVLARQRAEHGAPRAGPAPAVSPQLRGKLRAAWAHWSPAKKRWRSSSYPHGSRSSAPRTAHLST